MLDKAKLFGEELCHGRTDFKSGAIVYGLLLAPTIKHCLTIDKHGITLEHKTLNGFNDSKKF